MDKKAKSSYVCTCFQIGEIEFVIPSHLLVPLCSCGTLTNVLLHWNDILQTQDMKTCPSVTVCRYMAKLSLYYPLILNVTLKATATHKA